jgi:hypothetical protein
MADGGGGIHGRCLTYKTDTIKILYKSLQQLIGYLFHGLYCPENLVFCKSVEILIVITWHLPLFFQENSTTVSRIMQ